MRNHKRFAIAIVLVLAAAAIVRINFIRQNSWGEIMWNGDEAYLFVESSYDGVHISGLGHPWFIFKQFLGGFAAVVLPDDQRASLDVIQVTASGIKRHSLGLDRSEKGGPGSDPEKFTPLDGRIFAYCPWAIGQFMQDGHLVAKDTSDALCWWAGDHFNKATDDEKQRQHGIDRLSRGDFDNDASGWSRREFGAGPGSRNFTIDVGGHFRLAVNNATRENEGSTVSINVLRPGKSSERIGHFEARSGTISRSEYERIFHAHGGGAGI